MGISAFLTVAFRLLLIYFIVRLVWSLFAGRKNTTEQSRKKAARQPPRFDTQGKNVVDADYEDLK
jgi:hypothetical protein